jgi:hypothetical protein
MTLGGHRLVERSIFLWQQNCGNASVPFSDDPDFLAAARGIGREQAITWW